MPSTLRSIPIAAAIVLCGACATASAGRATQQPDPLTLTPTLNESLPPALRPRPAFVHADSGLIRVVHSNLAVKPVRLPTGRIVPQRDTSFHGGVAGVLVRTPTGAFAINVDSTAASAWADSVAALRPPVSVPSADGAAASVSLSGVVLQRVNSSTVLRLLRLGAPAGDSLPAYQLDASNGVWSGRLRLDPSAARELLAALRGTVAPMPADPSEPLVSAQVDVPARRLEAPAVVYPASVGNAHVNGDMYLEFVVGTDGRVEPGSLMLTGDPEPALAMAVREAVLRSHFAPATRGGMAVRQVVHESFALGTR